MDAAPRLLYEHGFDGWDISWPAYVTAYVVMVAGLVCAALTWNAMGRQSMPVWSLMSQFGIFSLLEGVGFGFAGMAHHLLDTYYEEGYIMGLSWGGPQSEWMFAWLFAVLIVPLASSSCLGTALAFGRLSDGWIKVAKAIGVLVSLFEGYLCLTSQFDSSNFASVCWGMTTSVLGCCVIFNGGTQAAGLWYVFFGNLIRVIGFAILMTVPEACKRSQFARYGCPYPDAFNHNAIYQTCLALSIVTIYCGVLGKYKKDKELASFEKLASPDKTGNRRCCGY